MAVLSRRNRSNSLLAAETDLAPPWLRRFAAPDGTVPVVVKDLFHAVLVALATDRDDAAVTDAAHALGVLRAHQGHGTSTLIEDVLALRPYLWGRAAELACDGDDPSELLLSHERVVLVVEQVMRAVIDAYVDETARTLAARAVRDPLTDLLNRAGFTEALEREIARADRNPPPSLVLIDLDGFKAVNDTAGHLVGDQVLTGVARLLERNARAGDVVARLGGDEFAVLMPATEPDRAAVVARRLIERSTEDRQLAWSGGRVGLSIGVAYLDRGGNAELLLAEADAAMYRAKRAGGGRVHLAVEVDGVAVR